MSTQISDNGKRRIGNNEVERQSNIELLRCFAMLCIILYHMLCFVVTPMIPDNAFYKAMWMPLHIGVPLFVLISGYFGIRFSLRGLMRFCSKVYVYLVPASIVYALVVGNEGVKEIIMHVFVFGTGFEVHWYLNVYLYLFLFSPIINRYLEKASLAQRLYLLIVLLFMSVYVGNMTWDDHRLLDGKNLTNFVLLYVLGNTIRHYQNLVDKISFKTLASSIFLYNIAIVLGYLFVPSLSDKIWKYGFAYNGILLITNSIFVFLLFTKISFSSRLINWLGGSIFACYLWQCLPFWNTFVLAPIRYWCQFGGGKSPFLLFGGMLVYAIVLILLMVFVDKLFKPLWNKLVSIASVYDEKWDVRQIL